MNKPISYIDDILDEVLEKNTFYYSRPQLKEAVKIYFDFLVAETKTNDVYAMKIPSIGRLYKNFNLTRNSVGKLQTDSKEKKEQTELLTEFRYNIDESIGFKAHNYTPYSFEYYKILKSKYIIKCPYDFDKQSLEILNIVEQIQNKNS